MGIFQNSTKLIPLYLFHQVANDNTVYGTPSSFTMETTNSLMGIEGIKKSSTVYLLKLFVQPEKCVVISSSNISLQLSVNET